MHNMSIEPDTLPGAQHFYWRLPLTKPDISPACSSSGPAYCPVGLSLSPTWNPSTQYFITHTCCRLYCNTVHDNDETDMLLNCTRCQMHMRKALTRSRQSRPYPKKVTELWAGKTINIEQYPHRIPCLMDESLSRHRTNLIW